MERLSRKKEMLAIVSRGFLLARDINLLASFELQKVNFAKWDSQLKSKTSTFWDEKVFGILSLETQTTKSGKRGIFHLFHKLGGVINRVPPNCPI